MPAIEARISAVDLTFIDEPKPADPELPGSLARRVVFPRPERLDLHADADDGIVGVRVDGKTVLELNSAPGITRTASTLQLGAGAHRLEIHYWQREGPQRLNVLWAPVGAAPEPLSPNRLFPEDPGATYWVLVASMRLPILVLLVWVAGPGRCSGGWAYRTASVVTGQELRTRVLTVLFPALLGPSQILLFGPWTVHGSNRTEFLVSFWELAPRWLWLLGPTVGMLVALGIILPARWFPRWAHSRFPGHALTPTGVMAIRCKQFHLPDL